MSSRTCCARKTAQHQPISGARMAMASPSPGRLGASGPRKSSSSLAESSGRQKCAATSSGKCMA
eukprot:9394872-Alexandrium_andersonii.AAC.1